MQRVLLHRVSLDRHDQGLSECVKLFRVEDFASIQVGDVEHGTNLIQISADFSEVYEELLVGQHFGDGVQQPNAIMSKNIDNCALFIDRCVKFDSRWKGLKLFAPFSPGILPPSSRWRKLKGRIVDR